MYEVITYEVNGAIAKIAVNRPKALNALSPQVLNELQDAFKAAENDENVKVIIFTGEGKAFIAGADISAMSTMTVVEGQEFSALGHKLANYIEGMNKPVIAAVNGFALGGGCELAMACDIRIASQKAKADETYLNEAREINNKIQNKEKGYFELYKKIVEISKEETKKVYDNINTNFEIWNGESDSLKYLDELNKIVEDKKVLRESEGAKVIDVAEDTDKIDIPPLLYIKSDGTISYETTDLTTILQRKKEFAPDEEIYITDFRQTLHFTQVFRAAKKLGLVSDGELSFYAFGTMNGTDGKPFKTRDGGVLQLKKLLELVYNETIKRIDFTKMEEDEGKEIAKTVAIAAIKYADLGPFRGTDYIFDIEKFTDIEGKTGPYILYSNIRMKSLLSKANDITIDNIYTIHKDLREIYLLVLNLANILISSYEQKSLNDITDYLYNICSLFNSFYAKNNVLKEENIDLKKSYLATINLVYYITNLLLDTLAIKIPEKM